MAQAAQSIINTNGSTTAAATNGLASISIPIQSSTIPTASQSSSIKPYKPYNSQNGNNNIQYQQADSMNLNGLQKMAISNNNAGLTNGTNPNRVSVNLNASNSTIPQYGINNNNSNSLNKSMTSSSVNTSRRFFYFLSLNFKN